MQSYGSRWDDESEGRRRVTSRRDAFVVDDDDGGRIGRLRLDRVAVCRVERLGVRSINSIHSNHAVSRGKGGGQTTTRRRGDDDDDDTADR